MARKALTDRLIRAVKPPASARLEIFDARLPGFCLRVTARGSATRRGYGGKSWLRTRRRILMRDPFCKEPGCNRPSKEVDHIVPRGESGSEDDDNLQGLCKPHHSAKTAREGRRWGQRPAAAAGGRGVQSLERRRGWTGRACLRVRRGN